jgi:hypothetical protein
MTVRAEAASQILAEQPRMQREVLKAILNAGFVGVTDEQICDETGLRESTARARRVELVASGLVIKTDRTRPTRSGRQATVWTASHRFSLIAKRCRGMHPEPYLETTITREDGSRWIRSVCRLCSTPIGYRPLDAPPQRRSRKRGKVK